MKEAEAAMKYIEKQLDHHPWLEQAAMIDAQRAKDLGHDVFSNEHIHFLALSLGAGVGELQGMVKRDWETNRFKYQHPIEMKMADISLYLFRMFAVLGIDIDTAVTKRLNSLAHEEGSILNKLLKEEKPERETTILRSQLSEFSCSMEDCDSTKWEWGISSSFNCKINCASCAEVYEVIEDNTPFGGG